MVGGEKPSRGFFLTRMKHPPLDSPSSLSPPRCLVRTSSRAVCTRLSRLAQLSGVLPVLSRSSRICPLDRLAVCVVGLGLALVLVRWWWSLVLVFCQLPRPVPRHRKHSPPFMWEKFGIRPVPLQRLHVGRSAAGGEAGAAGAAGADGGGMASKRASSQSASASVVVVVVVIGFGWCGDRTRTGVGFSCGMRGRWRGWLPSFRPSPRQL